MKLVLIIFTAVIAHTTAASLSTDKLQFTDWEYTRNVTEEEASIKAIPIQGRAAILSKDGKRRVESFINHLPCGWPEAGIPPLAPYAKKEITFKVKKSILELSQKLEYFRIDGLDIMLIERLKVSYAFRKSVKFDLTFPRITISGKYFTDFFADALKLYGISVRYEGSGDFEVVLENLNARGSLRYKMPLLTGDTEIYKFDITLALGNFVSKIGGIGGSGKLNRLLNSVIEESVLFGINSNQYEISETLKEVLETYINEKLKGRNMWTFFKTLFGQKGKICYPPPYPW